LGWPNFDFLQITTYEKKNGFLLIEVFSKLFNTQIQATWIISRWPFLAMRDDRYNENTFAFYKSQKQRG